MPAERTTPDALTIAYIAMGAQKFMETDEFQQRTTEPKGGELEFVGEVIDHALMLDCKADKREADFLGVFLYEVADLFGYQIAKMLTNEGQITRQAAEDLADTLIAANCL